MTGQRVYFGVYTCLRCQKDYTVDDGTWRRCTPDYCHDCVEVIVQGATPSDVPSNTVMDK